MLRKIFYYKSSHLEKYKVNIKNVGALKFLGGEKKSGH